MSLPERPTKILQVVGFLDRGGIETWLMHILRSIDRSKFQIDFLVHTTEESDYDEEARQLGAKILSCPHVKNPLRYRRDFLRILKENGPYDVVHSHVLHFSGYTLWLAHQAGVTKRISHSHDTSSIDMPSSLGRKKYTHVMRYLIRRHATCGLAASELAAQALYGSDWKTDPRWRVFYYTIEMNPFQRNRSHDNQKGLKKEFGLPTDAFVVGHTGRFFEQKNHSFLIDIALEAIQQSPNVYFLLVGDGPLRPKIEEKVRSNKLNGRVLFAGLRSDVPDIMCNVFDVFVMPSLYEGLCLVGIEAQTAGLPFVVSDTVTPEVKIVPDLVTFHRLSDSPAEWASTLLSYQNGGRKVSKEDAMAIMLKTSFNIEVGLEDLQDIYESNTS